MWLTHNVCHSHVMSSPCNALERNCGGLPRCLYFWFPVLSRVAKMRMSQVVCFLKTATKYRALVNFCVFATLYKIPYLRLWSHQEQWSRSWHRRFFVPGAQHSYPRSWRAQEEALPSWWRSAARRFFYSHAHGEPKRPGSSVIIMKFRRRTHLI